MLGRGLDPENDDWADFVAQTLPAFLQLLEEVAAANAAARARNKDAVAQSTDDGSRLAEPAPATATSATGCG